MLTRRHFLRSTAALGLMPMLSPASLLGRQALHARIGDKLTIFSMEFGGSRLEDRFSVYGDPNDQLADYWVDTNDTDIAERVAIDFSPLPGGGLPSSRTVIGWSRFLRDDAVTYNPVMHLGGLNPNRHNFHVGVWHSQDLAADLRRSGNVIVVDEDAGGSSISPVGAWNILRTQVGMESFNVHPITRTFGQPGASSDLENWFMTYSLTERDDKLAYIVDNPPIPGLWLVGKWVYELDISFDEPISMKESSDLVGSMLAIEGTESWTTYFHPTPDEPFGMRVNGFNVGPNAWPHYVLRYVKDGEENGTADRLIMRAENPLQAGRLN